MQRVRLALCNRKAASLFGELSAPAGFVGAISRSFLCLFRQPGRGGPDEIGWVRLLSMAAAARLICLPILLSSIRRLFCKPLSAVGRSWLRAGSADFQRQVSEVEGRYEAAESWAQDWRGSRAMHAVFCSSGPRYLRSFSGERSLLLFSSSFSLPSPFPRLAKAAAMSAIISLNPAAAAAVETLRGGLSLVGA